MKLLVPLALMLLVSPALADRDEQVANLFEEGNAFMEKGQHAEALRKYEDALNLEPRAKGPLYNGGLAAYLLGKPAKAIELWTRLKEITPHDGKLRAKLVQAFEAAGMKKKRDEEIRGLYELRKSGEDPELPHQQFFCRDQFEAGKRKVMVFHHYDWVGARAVRYAFIVLDDDGKPDFRISLGSYEYMQSFAKSSGQVKEGERYCHLDLYEGNMHATLGMYQKEPPYDEIKAEVVKHLESRAKKKEDEEK
jgi:tetratricopeptide (TPR) repeat protein